MPSSVRSIFRSVRMRARTGNAVMDMAMPMNRAKLANGTPAGANPRYKARARADPRTNGRTMLAWDTATADRACFRSRAAFSSRPTRNMYRTTPMDATALTAAGTRPFGSAAGAGMSRCMASGQAAPSRDGPRAMPATTSPITGGWPTHRHAHPSAVPRTMTAARVAMTWRTTSIGLATATAAVAAGSARAAPAWQMSRTRPTPTVSEAA
jgi:hypothetical protein